MCYLKRGAPDVVRPVLVVGPRDLSRALPGATTPVLEAFIAAVSALEVRPSMALGGILAVKSKVVGPETFAQSLFKPSTDTRTLSGSARFGSLGRGVAQSKSLIAAHGRPDLLTPERTAICGDGSFSKLRGWKLPGEGCGLKYARCEFELDSSSMYESMRAMGCVICMVSVQTNAHFAVLQNVVLQSERECCASDNVH